MYQFEWRCHKLNSINRFSTKYVFSFCYYYLFFNKVFNHERNNSIRVIKIENYFSLIYFLSLLERMLYNIVEILIQIVRRERLYRL